MDGQNTFSSYIQAPDVSWIPMYLGLFSSRIAAYTMSRSRTGLCLIVHNNLGLLLLSPTVRHSTRTKQSSKVSSASHEKRMHPALTNSRISTEQRSCLGISHAAADSLNNLVVGVTADPCTTSIEFINGGALRIIDKTLYIISEHLSIMPSKCEKHSRYPFSCNLGLMMNPSFAALN